MNQVRNLLIILVLVTLLQSLVTLAILTTERQTQSNVMVLQQQLAEMSTRLSRASTALDSLTATMPGGLHHGGPGGGMPGSPNGMPGSPGGGMPGSPGGQPGGTGPGTNTSSGNGNGGGGGHRNGGGGEQAGGTRGEGIVIVLAELMVLMGNNDTMLTAEQSDQVKTLATDYSKGQHEGIRKRFKAVLTAPQSQYLSAHEAEVESKATKLHEIPNSNDTTYAELITDVLDKPLRPDGQRSSSAPH